MSPFTVGLIASLIALVFMYIDTRLFDNPKSRTTYVKNMLLTGSITGFLFYLIGNGGFKVDFDIEAPSAIGMLGGNISNTGNLVNSINEDILIGMPKW